MVVLHHGEGGCRVVEKVREGDYIGSAERE